MSVECNNDVRRRYSWCEVCLVSNVRMCSIENEQLIEIYEKLTNTQPSNDYGLPEAICYICYSLLQRACRFSYMAHKSQRILEELHQQGVEVNKMEVLPNFGIALNISLSNISTTYIPNYSNSKNALDSEAPIVVKEEQISDVEQSEMEEMSSEENEFFDTSYIIEPYVCDVCNEVFKYKSYWLSHIRTHTGDKQYECNICNEAFTSKSNLQSHKATHTEEKSYYDSNIYLEWHKSILITHVRTLGTEKPEYVCNICYKAFNSKSNLQFHMRMRTGVQKYVCNTCNRGFINKSNLQYHISTHTEVTCV